jgi:anti-sigma factor RsiW
MSSDLHTLSGAFALDALTEDEAAEFHRHLTHCQACRDEVRELRETAGRLGAGDAMRPPPALRARVLEAAARQPQLPPRLAPAGRARRRMPRLLAAAAVVVAVVGAGIGVLGIRGGTQAPLSPSVSRVFNAPDAHKATVRTANGGRLTVATSHRLNEMAVDTERLPELGRAQVYQIWAVHGRAMTPAAVLKNAKAGAAMTMPGPGTKVAITIEPAGGSEQPTTEPIVTVDPAGV